MRRKWRSGSGYGEVDMEESGDGIGDRRKWKEVRNLVRNLVVKRFRDPVL